MRNNKGFSIIEWLLLLIIIAILIAVGWYVWQAKDKTDNNFNNANSANSSAADFPKNDPYAGWKEYCSKQEKGCFKYPADWVSSTVDPIAIEGSSGDGYKIISPKGTVIRWSSEISGIGGACDPTTEPHVFIDQIKEVTNVKGLYAVAISDGKNINGVGLVDKINGAAPKKGDIGDCLLIMVFKSKDGQRDVQFESSTNYKPTDLDIDMKILTSYHY